MDAGEPATAPPLGLGIVGAGRFAAFVAGTAATLPGLAVAAVTDPDGSRAAALADAHGATVLPDVTALLGDDRVRAVVVAAPPDTHAPVSLRALAAGRHVFCEKPVALADADADAVRAAVAATGLTYVVDHVLRYNPVLAALVRLRAEGLLGPVRRLAFENDAADEDLGPGHWFWDDAVSGGILLEHGVHFFDAAAMLIGTPARAVQAMGACRPDGRIDTVVATVAHEGGALASHAHGFSHAHRAERQLMRLDFGLAEARIHGWIPLRADLDAWTDRPEAFEELPARAGELLAVPGFEPSGRERVTVSTTRDAGPPTLRTRDVEQRAPHHVTACVDLGGPEVKWDVYRRSVAAALLDLARAARDGSRPRADIDAGRAAVRVAVAGTAALRDGGTHAVAGG